jgi:hypothetical protein
MISVYLRMGANGREKQLSIEDESVQMMSARSSQDHS